MAKRHNKKRHFQKREHKTHIRAYAENYYKQQANTINRLKPVMAAARHFNDRTVQAERDSRSTANKAEVVQNEA